MSPSILRVSIAALLVLLAASAPRPAGAQTMDPRLVVPRLHPGRMDAVAVRAVPPVDGAGRVAPGWLAVGGVGGAALGLAGGLAIGGLIDGRYEGDCIIYCLGAGAATGALVGEVIGVAAGVHLANGRKGSLPLGMAASAGVLVVSLLVAQEAPVVFFLIPVSQVVGAIAAERSTERR